MKLTVLASSSTGNGYLLHNEKECLVLECGVRLSTVKKALDFNTSIIKGVLVSHRHLDHSKYISNYLEVGITVLSHSSVFGDLESKYSYLCKALRPEKGYKIGRFKVIAFPVHHDVPCYGYLIDHPETGLILFITDTYMCDYHFVGLKHILIEANYMDHILEQNIISGSVHPSMRPRLLTTHMELETCKGILKANDLNGVINIVLVHLSAGNSDEQLFVREVKELTGKQVYAAKRGLELDFSVNPY